MKKLLDRHGYSFQRAVERAIRELGTQNGFAWSVHTEEFPVAGMDWTTRIDLLLASSHNPLWMVAECKRVDPAFGWFFARGGRHLTETVVVERFEADGNRMSAGHRAYPTPGGVPYHIAVVGKSGAGGDGTGAGRDQIEDAATQVLRGVSGLVNFFADQHTPHVYGVEALVTAAIVTTAQLYTTEADLSLASLRDGLLPEDIEVVQKGWLWYQYQRSPHLSSRFRPSPAGRSPSEANRYIYPRTIAVVNAEHLSQFLWDVK